MSVRVAVVLLCDVRRARGCHGQYAISLGRWVLPGAEERVRLEAPGTGWTREADGRDARPACSQRRLQALQPGWGA
jgi:hypothetical protein